ncbi:NACHT, LRR and PYD domains-containing protein 1b allele 2-like [Thunnus thynnus]|uniref:NACHT, LRR and PYD domains-containing protein 1b allele 2-like n=1 Tax=Thunnus thynnus TaxID=8237 RepID=UPI0035280E98
MADTKASQKSTDVAAPSQFTPELLSESGDTSYRFTCPGPGVFWCMLTKLVFSMDREGELLYRIVQWDESLLHSAGKKPAGPLFDIKCSEDAVSKLHLPHCEIKPVSLSDNLSVVHISDDGMSILEPLEITDTHVIVDVPHLSALGLVRDFFKSLFNPVPKPISGQVLLFRQPTGPRQRPKFHVFLLPENVLVREVKKQHETAEHIVAPSSCQLIDGQTYTLNCPEAHKILSECAPFNSKYGPNYHPTFEIRLTPSIDEATMTVQDEQERQVWEYHVELTGPDPGRENRPQSLSGDEEKRLYSVQKEFIRRVSSPVLKDLLDALRQHGVINCGEMESIQVIKLRTDKARELMETVLRKGDQACKILMDTFNEVDPWLYEELGLQ